MALLGTAAFWGPPLLRRVPWFTVERVEVSGARLLAPHEVLAASGIHAGQNVWDDPAGWTASLRAHPVVADAEVSRNLPGTLRIRIEERRPVALLDAGTLRPATATGQLLPVDPARAAVDLPLVRPAHASPGDSVGPDARAMLAEIGRLDQLDPELAARVSEVRTAPAGDLMLVLSRPAAEVLLPRGAGSARLGQLHAVVRDVERRSAAATGAPERGAEAELVRIDLRFRDQIVVRSSSQD